MRQNPTEEELTAAVREVPGATDVYPPPTVLSDPPETLGALLHRDLGALSKVDLHDGPDGAEVTARIGVDRSQGAPATARAAAEAIAARFDDDDAPLRVIVRVTRIS